MIIQLAWAVLATCLEVQGHSEAAAITQAEAVVPQHCSTHLLHLEVVEVVVTQVLAKQERQAVVSEEPCLELVEVEVDQAQRVASEAPVLVVARVAQVAQLLLAQVVQETPITEVLAAHLLVLLAMALLEALTLEVLVLVAPLEVSVRLEELLEQVQTELLETLAVAAGLLHLLCSQMVEQEVFQVVVVVQGTTQEAVTRLVALEVKEWLSSRHLSAPSHLLQAVRTQQEVETIFGHSSQAEHGHQLFQVPQVVQECSQ